MRPVVARPVALVMLGLLLAPSPSGARERPRVVVLPIAGSAGVVEAAVEEALSSGHELVAGSEWDAAARRLFATSHGASDVATVARELGVQVVVTGAIRDEKGWSLSLAARHGATGKRAARLRYPLAGPEPDAATLRRVAAEIVAAVERAAAGAIDDGAADRAAAGSADEGAADRAAAGPGDVGAVDRATAGAMDGGAGESAVDGGGAGGGPRPSIAAGAAAPGARYFEGAVGLLVGGRHFEFAPLEQPSFASTAAEGLHLDATGYPLAALSIPALTGLGLGVRFDGVFWPDAVPCVRDASDACMSTEERYRIRELRWELGPRWRWSPRGATDGFEVLAAIQYGQHALTIDKRPDGSDLGPPDVAYSYVTFGVGGHVPVHRAVALAARFNYHALVGEGPVSAATEYGPGSGTGLRVDGGVELRIWKGLALHLEGFYERFSLTFNGTTRTDRMARGAVDQYWGAVISLGWVYRRTIERR